MLPASETWPCIHIDMCVSDDDDDDDNDDDDDDDNDDNDSCIMKYGEMLCVFLILSG